MPARSWVLVDERSGDVLEERNSRAVAPIASATKMMTALVAARELPPAKVVEALGYSANAGESLLGLRPGEPISVRDLLYGSLLASGNDAAAALAVAASGSEDAFAAEMNATAERLGLGETTFFDPIGLSPGNVSSAADLVKLASELRSEPLLAEIVDTERITLRGDRRRRIINRNPLVVEVPWVDGVKTGFTDEAGHVLVASGERKGVPLVAAVLGAPSEEARDAAGLALLRYGAALYRPTTVVGEGEQLASVRLELRDRSVPLVAAGPLRPTIRADQAVEVSLDFPAEARGPFDRGDRLGTAEVVVDGESAGRVGLLAAGSADAPDLIDRLDSEFPGGRTALLVSIVAGALLLAAAARSAIVARRRRSR